MDRRSLIISVGLHVSVGVLAWIGLPSIKRDLPGEQPIVVMEMVQSVPTTNLTQGDKPNTAKKEQKAAKSRKPPPPPPPAKPRAKPPAPKPLLSQPQTHLIQKQKFCHKKLRPSPSRQLPSHRHRRNQSQKPLPQQSKHQNACRNHRQNASTSWLARKHCKNSAKTR
jgi:hypothetical protein